MNKHGREPYHYLKIGKILVSMDLCILNQERNDSWFQEKHRQETVALLQEVIAERIHAFYAKKRAARSRRGDKEAKHKTEQPKMLQGNTVKIGYKFTKRLVTQRCLLMKLKFESITLFPEKLHVYVCEYHPSTVLQTTAQLLHVVNTDSTLSTVGISDYFQSASDLETGRVTVATTSALKKRNKLKRIVSRQDDVKPADKEPYFTENGYSISAGKPEKGHKAKKTKGEADGRLSPRGKVRTKDADEAKDADGAGGGMMKSEAIGASKKIALRHFAQGQNFMTSGRESVSTTGTLGEGSGVSEPVKKRKRNKDWGVENLRNKAASAHHGTGLDLPGGETREPLKRQRTGDTIIPSREVSSTTMQNGGCVTDLRTKDWSRGLVAREDDVVVAREKDVVAREDDVVTLEDNAGDEIVDLCGEEIFSDGDVDCRDSIPPDPESMGKLSILRLQRLVQRNRRYLKQIFIGKRSCRRHADYKQGGSARANLTYKAWYGPYSEEQVECIMSELVKVYCANHNRYFDYISKVLLPEALTKICMDVLHISLEEAQAVLEKTPLCGDSTLLGSRFQGVEQTSVTQY